MCTHGFIGMWLHPSTQGVPKFPPHHRAGQSYCQASNTIWPSRKFLLTFLSDYSKLFMVRLLLSFFNLKHATLGCQQMKYSFVKNFLFLGLFKSICYMFFYLKVIVYFLCSKRNIKLDCFVNNVFKWCSLGVGIVVQ